MIAIPEESGVFTPAPPGTKDIVVEIKPKQNPIKKYALDRQRKLLAVILKLAQNGSYDDTGFLVRSDGSRLEEADLISLLLFAMSPGRTVTGLEDFIKILARSGVKPDDVINDQVRVMLSKYMARMTNSPRKTTIDMVPPTVVERVVADHNYAAPNNDDNTNNQANPPDNPIMYWDEGEEERILKRKRPIADEGHGEQAERLKAPKKTTPWDLSDDEDL